MERVRGNAADINLLRVGLRGRAVLDDIARCDSVGRRIPREGDMAACATQGQQHAKKTRTLRARKSCGDGRRARAVRPNGEDIYRRPGGPSSEQYSTRKLAL